MQIDLLRRLCETPGASGREERVRELIKKQVKGLFDTIETDAMGSLICTRKPTATKRGRGKATRVMIAAHMDEIGFYVRHIDENGFIWVNPAGGFDARNLFSRRVLVCCDDGDHEGVMNPGGKPVHIATPEDRKKIPELDEFFVDLGMDARTVKRKVKIGDYVVMNEPFIDQPKKVVSKALDNRVACFIAIEALKKLGRSRAAASKHACEVVVVFTVQEEVGLRGATTAAHAVGADIGIGLDTTLACDTPGVTDTLQVTRHGEGVAIMVQDSSMIADHRLVNDLCDVASKNKIACQRSVLPRGGQDGAAIQKAGVGARTAAIVCGTRYIHTVTESIDKKDLQSAIDLLAAWLPTIK
ncbi:MAG: M20/M25/M40 family metallo-hydrolase [Planctomycetota bacterium]|nr:M20/M25/M40 family metallo-hydrolase [Planctomycetota bacterium]